MVCLVTHCYLNQAISPQAISPIIFSPTSNPHSEDPRIAKVAFTGSCATGQRVALSAAKNLRPAGLELGGKSALLVFGDAEVDKAVEWAMFGSFWTNGQICSSTSRLLIHKSISAAFLERLKVRGCCCCLA